MFIQRQSIFIRNTVLTFISAATNMLLLMLFQFMTFYDLHFFSDLSGNNFGPQLPDTIFERLKELISL